ncbi:MAG: hypothetical protein JRH18_16955 [Deltaproteobacteria bacterium]|nr:hypothetical protein [Deltaproteobacteria bacterium]MBW1962675.1 hypothetical protein [Deltaproteobacteria bacterium]MBW2153347.1 hypothetical protein [Deltaproteobacteria bacterium]
MVWMVEKKIFHHMIDLGFESVNIPIRVKFEFEIREGAVVPGSMVIHTLYNKQVLEKRYPHLKAQALEKSINETVKKRIRHYLIQCGYVYENHAHEYSDSG